MTPERQKWLMLLGAELRKRLETETLPPGEIDLLLGQLREIEEALAKVTFVRDTGERDEPPDEPSRDV
jgi:hypothetical protein